MTILFPLVIILLIALLLYQNDRFRKWISDLFSNRKARLVVLITLLALLALVYPRINTQIKKLKRDLNPSSE